VTRHKSSGLARRLGLREVEVHFGTFDFTVYVIAGPFKQGCEYIAQVYGDDCYRHLEPAHGYCFTKPAHEPVIWVPGVRTSKQHGTLAHEMLHAVRYMLHEWADTPFSRKTEEAYCHALGHGVKTVLDALRKA
jgi:hypothetical protein